MARCPKCKNILPAPAEIYGGMPGIKYRECPGCGWTQAVTKRQQREKITDPKREE